MIKKVLAALIGFLSVILVAVVVYFLPPVHSRLAWRVDDLRTRFKYSFNPPEEVVFLPGETSGEVVVSPTPAATSTPTLTPAAATPTPLVTLVPTFTPTPLPDSYILDGVKYEDQHGRLNYCGPANLSMALTFWGWDGNRDVVGQAIKPLTGDKNVMPYEMVEFTALQPGLKALERMGGDLELVKLLVSNGFPVVMEKGVFLRDLAGEVSWMGHYVFVTGFDESRDLLIVQDTYEGQDFEYPYDRIISGWRAFNYVFVVVYPQEREAEVLALLGPLANETYGYQVAAERAAEEIYTTRGPDLFFAWFNRGTSLAMLQDYAGAAAAYDEAFATHYPAIARAERPWRMMWYQTGPYRAYFYSGRYYDVISLATTTLDTMSKPEIEESFYWRALAKEALGDLTGAVDDLREAMLLNPNFNAGQAQLDRLQGGG